MNSDGILDASELDGIFFYQADKHNLTSDSKEHGLVVADNKIGEDDMDNYIHGGYGTYNKRPLQVNEML